MILKKQKGSLTVEAVLIIPIIIMAIFWLMNISLYMYHFAFLKIMSHDAVSMVQRSWENPSELAIDGDVDVKGVGDEPLYWHLTGMKEGNNSRFEEYTNTTIKTDPLSNIMAKDLKKTIVSIKVEREMLFRWRVDVEIKENRTSVFSGIRKKLGLPAEETILAKSSGIIEDPAELIRNCDLADELVRAVPVFDDILWRIEDMRDKLFKMR